MIQVRDTGIGIAPKDLSKVMTPFGQVDSALSRKYEGTGLGLPLAKAFLESMGGEFTIESELNVGTTVTLSLPKAPAKMPMMQAEEKTNVAHDSTGAAA
jgi:signal transduction histidine kinase